MGSLSSDFGFGLGDDDVLVVDGIIPVPIQAEAVNRLVEQFRSQPNWQALISALASPAQDFENLAITPMPSIANIDTAQGAQLDVLGKRLGELRQGFDDFAYRLHLKARIWLNRGSGSPEELYGMFRMLSAAGTTMYFEQQPPAAFVLHLGGVAQSSTLAPYLLKFLKLATDLGVNGQLHWLSATAGASFSFLGGPGLGFDAGLFSSVG